MRRWRFWHRLMRDARPHDRDRCILVVEQLEEREVPAFVGSTPEGMSFAFDSMNGTFDPFELPYFMTFTATVTATNGTLDATNAAAFDLSVGDNGTAAVTLTGLPQDINDYFASGNFTFVPVPFYSGDATVALTVTDPSGIPEHSDSGTVRVEPVASKALLFVAAAGEILAPASGFDFPAGFVTISGWDDTDSSERILLTFALEADDPTAEFTLSADGVEIAPSKPNFWQVSGTDPAAFQALLDSLVLTPPAGFSGRAFLNVFGSPEFGYLIDQASFASFPTSVTDFRELGFGSADFRFFQGGSVTTPTAFAQEGGTIDLGGRYVATDPDDLPGDTHTLTLSVPGGTLAFDPSAVPSGLSVNQSGNTITLDGPLVAINAFLAAPGSLTYSPPDPYFSGIVPLTITLTNHPANTGMGDPNGLGEFPVINAPGAFTGVAALAFVPVADHVFPSATDVTTNQDTPVVLSIGLSALADLDGSESVLVILEGVPAGASFDRGTALGSGQWAFAPADLPGLTFTPPPGATGAFAMTVKVVVTDSASGLPTDVETASAAFTVTVLPADVPVVPPDTDDPIDESDFLEPVVVDTSLEDTTSAEDDEDDEELSRPANTNAAVFVNAYSSAGSELQFGPTETQVSLAPPAQGSLFAQAEVPLPIYGDGERHPLPPVLPLDQTLPVAGFTESGGDSIALVDKLYRDAVVPSVGTPVTLAPEVPTESAERLTPAPAVVAPVPPSANAPDAVTAAPVPAEEDVGGEWRVWAAGTVIAGSLAAWVWLSRGTDGFLARAVRRFFRAAHRRPTERTA